MDVSEIAEIADIGRAMEYNCRLQIDVWVWAGIDGRDSQIITINTVKYEGQKLLDMVARDVVDELDDHKADFDNDTKALHNMKILAKVDMGVDSERKQLIRKRIEVSFDYFR